MSLCGVCVFANGKVNPRQRKLVPANLNNCQVLMFDVLPGLWGDSFVPLLPKFDVHATCFSLCL